MDAAVSSPSTSAAPSTSTDQQTTAFTPVEQGPLAGWVGPFIPGPEAPGQECYYRYYNTLLQKEPAEYVRLMWHEARDFCLSPVSTGLDDETLASNVHLVTIASREENDFVWHMLRDYYLEYSNR